MMVLPGWNVTEPIQVAGKFYTFVQEYRGADKQIKSFASQVETFRAALKALDECLMNPDSTPLDDNHHLKIASDGCKHCAENCQKFINNFFRQFDPKQLHAPPRDEVGPGHRLNWIWKKDAATKLEQEMSHQVDNINLHLNIAERNDRRWKHSETVVPPAPVEVPIALTPGDLLALHPENKVTVSIPRDPEPLPELQSYGSSPTEYVPREILQRRDSGISLLDYQKTVMDNLAGVTIYRKTDNRAPLSVKKLEFLKHSSGSLRYIIATLPDAYQVKFFHEIPPSSQVIPHTEHPAAYKDRKILRIKFLESHQLTSERWPIPSSSSSIRSLSISSPFGTPETLPSNASFSDSTSIGSPLLSPNTAVYKKETNYPKYEFKNERDYESFQEHILGKSLLANVPVDNVASKYLNSSKIHRQSEMQYLRLWESSLSQTIMYYANKFDEPRYLEHDTQCFDINQYKSDSTVLYLEVQQPSDLPSILPKKQGSLKSFINSPVLWSKDSRKSTKGDATSPTSEIPRRLDNLSCLIITFTKASGKTEFLNRATFNAT